MHIQTYKFHDKERLFAVHIQRKRKRGFFFQVCVSLRLCLLNFVNHNNKSVKKVYAKKKNVVIINLFLYFYKELFEVQYWKKRNEMVLPFK